MVAVYSECNDKLNKVKAVVIKHPMRSWRNEPCYVGSQPFVPPANSASVSWNGVSPELPKGNVVGFYPWEGSVNFWYHSGRT